MLELILVIIVGIVPPLLSLLMIRQAKQRWQTRLRRVSRTDWYYRYQRSNFEQSVNEHNQSVDIATIGETSCIYNARSPYIRCAINPTGPCVGCKYYQKNI